MLETPLLKNVTPSRLGRMVARASRDELARRIAAIAVKAADPTGDSTTTCKAIITDDEGRVLVLKDASSAWNDLPGGHIKEGEAPEEGLRREVKEETGLEIKNIKQFETIFPETPNQATKKIIFFKANTTGGEVKLSEEHEGFVWAKPSELDALNLGFWKQPVKDALGGKPLPQTPNQKHVTATVLRTARLQSVANWLVSQDKKTLAKLKADIAAAIKANNPTGAGGRAQQQARCEALFKITDAKVKEAFDGMAADALARFDQLSSAIHEVNQKRLKAHFDVNVTNDAPEASRLLVMGATLREQYTYLANQMIYKVHTVVRQGVAQGETASEIVQRLDGSAASSPVNASEPFHGTTKYLCGHASSCRCSKQHETRTVEEKCPLCKSKEIQASEPSVKCPHCKHVFDDTKLPEIAMGAVACPKCKKTVTQENVIASGNEFGRFIVHAALSDDAAAAVDKRLSVGVKIFDGTESSLDKIISAAVNALANMVDAEDMGFDGDDEDEDEENSTMGWQWVAVLDMATCPTCEFYDGHQWTAEYEPYTEDDPEYPGDPALHPGCRCAVVPVDLEDQKPGHHAPEAGAMRPATKPKDISFDDYLSQFSNKELEQAFGKATLANYRRGDITANQLIGQKNNLMTLEQFKNAELGE